MYQLCYASQIKSNPENLLQDLRDILSEARDFNVRHQIKGGLCYADGVFFQCLEGDQDTVLGLLGKISNDQRHHEVNILLTQQIDSEPHFQDWSMKFIGRHSEIHQYFEQLGSQQFNPLLLQQQSLQHFLELLYHLPEQTL